MKWQGSGKEPFRKLSINMKYIVLILFVIISGAFTGIEKCTLNFEHSLNGRFLKLWDAKTKNKMIESKDEKSRVLLNFETKNKGIIFDRGSFQKVFKRDHKYSNIDFSKLWILEINYTGEKNQRIKYLIGACGSKSHVIKYALGTTGWRLIQTHIIETQKFENLCTLLKDKRKHNYWGYSPSEIGCLTQIKGRNDVNVQVFTSLSKIQFDAISGLNAKN